MRVFNTIIYSPVLLLIGIELIWIGLNLSSDDINKRERIDKRMSELERQLDSIDI